MTRLPALLSLTAHILLVVLAGGCPGIAAGEEPGLVQLATAPPLGSPTSTDTAAPDPSAQLNLRGTPCPLNFIRSKLALEKLALGAWLQVDLDAGEPGQMVASGLREAGQYVEVEALEPGAVRLLIQRLG